MQANEPQTKSIARLCCAWRTAKPLPHSQLFAPQDRTNFKTKSNGRSQVWNFRTMTTRTARKRAQLEEWKHKRKQKQAADAKERQIRYQNRANRQQRQKKTIRNAQKQEKMKFSVGLSSKLSVPTQSQTETTAYRKRFGIARSRFKIH